MFYINLFHLDFCFYELHPAGPDKELFQLAVFGELRALLPHNNVHIEFVGPAIPEYRSVIFDTKLKLWILP